MRKDAMLTREAANKKPPTFTTNADSKKNSKKFNTFVKSFYFIAKINKPYTETLTGQECNVMRYNIMYF